MKTEFLLLKTRKGYSLKLGRESMVQFSKNNGFWHHLIRRSFDNFPFYYYILNYTLETVKKEPQINVKVIFMHGVNGRILTHYPFI